MNSKIAIPIAVIIACGLIVPQAVSSPAQDAQILYFEDFNGSASEPLQGKVPNKCQEFATWQSGGDADSEWKADGSIKGSADPVALLPFKPESGKVYTLSIDIVDIQGYKGWLALGFTEANAVNRVFIAQKPNGWMLHRIGGGSQTFMGTGTNARDEPAGDTKSSLANMKVVLNTKPQKWTVTWYVDDIEVRPETAFEKNPTINFVGFGKHVAAECFVKNFSLSARH